MKLNPFPNFSQFPTHHCWTGSLKHIYDFFGYSISEEMLLGLGAGVGFVYWHTKGSLPFLGGRVNFARPGNSGLESTVGRLTGVSAQAFYTQSAAKAEKQLIALLEQKIPVMLVVDMGFLPYFNFGGEEFHFGSHVVVACGYDEIERTVLLADRELNVHVVSLDTVAKARGSTFKPFPPQHGWFEFDFQHAHPVDPKKIFDSVKICADGMLHPAISNFGVKGIRKAAERIRKWLELLDEKALRDTCINTAIMIDSRGGTGGGIFRYLYARFLIEASEATRIRGFIRLSVQMQKIGDLWQEVSEMFEQAFRAENPVPCLDKVVDLLPVIAEQEEDTWSDLYSLAAQMEG
jgi:hypothetical protein